ncbi:hypothetical protein H0H93_010784 [Arthromyces matolae]|nr:hypothetical protein H0H93_010784 [Arthromyces matolae]
MSRRAHQEVATPGPRMLRKRAESVPESAPKPRRTSEQVRKDNAEKEKEKEKKKEARKLMISEVAHLETSLVEEDAHLLMQAHHPPPSTQKKIRRARTITTAGGMIAETGLGDNKTAGELGFNQSTADFGEDHTEMRLTNSDDEPDAPAVHKSNKKGATVRTLVAATRHAGVVASVASEEEVSGGAHKRKASASSLRQAVDLPAMMVPSSKKIKKHNGGLRNDWTTYNAATTISERSQDVRTVIPQGLTTQRSRALSTVSSKASHDNTPRAEQDNEASEDNESYGGISDDASGGKAERAKMVEDSKPIRRGTQVKSLARVVDTSSVPEFVPGISAKILKGRHLGATGFGKKKAEIRITDLKESVRRIWDSSFKPRIIEYLGTLTPWQPFSDDDVAAVQDIWADVYPYEPRLEASAQLNFIVNKLVDDIITAWQHKFSSTANQYLVSNIFESPELRTPPARQIWAEWALARDVTEEELENAPENCRRFYYREYEEPEEPGGEATSKGIFQSPIIIATLASHFQSLEKLQGQDRGEEFPIGALVLTIQACRHHISQWTTGFCVKPPGPLANFSAANWGDRRDREGPSSFKDARLTSDIVDTVEGLTKSKWDRIRAAVTEYLKRQNKRNTKRLVPLNQAQSDDVKPMRPRFKLRDQDSDSEDEDDAQAGASTPEFEQFEPGPAITGRGSESLSTTSVGQLGLGDDRNDDDEHDGQPGGSSDRDDE